MDLAHEAFYLCSFAAMSVPGNVKVTILGPLENHVMVLGPAAELEVVPQMREV